MNAVEIEEAVSQLAEEPFDAAEFPWRFLEAFGNKNTTIKRLRSGVSNRSDAGGVLLANHIHLAVAAPGDVAATLNRLRESPATAKAKAKFILATDGATVEAEELVTGDVVVCEYVRLGDYFGHFLPLAGITTVEQIRENPFDIRATSRLNRLYLELLKDNPEWGSALRRPDMNHFMARLIFCFFAEDTDIFGGDRRFTDTVELMSARDSSNTHEVIGELFRAMNLREADREAAGIARWARPFPYVNGGLFSGSMDVPRFSKLARSYLLHIGKLDWTKINPDIFGSMIQAVADDEERGSLGMHYTSVPNILKVLNPLFLDELRERLTEAGDSPRALLNLRKRLAHIRVFDPACGSGNFLVIAYKQLREIESEINRRRGEPTRATDIPLTNFRGIELRDFPAEVARLALIIARFQCDVLYRGKQLALAEFLPLDSQSWITCGNALRLDWLSLCPPTGSAVKLHGEDLFNTPLDQPEIDFENAGGETYICGNPPYTGKGKKDGGHLDDMAAVFSGRTKRYGYVDYVGCWFLRAADYCRSTSAAAAFVATNSICQGRQLPQLWPLVLSGGLRIQFAHQSFKWANSAARNAGVMCVIVAIAKQNGRPALLFAGEHARVVSNISPYLVQGDNTCVESVPRPLAAHLPLLVTGSVPNDGGNLLFTHAEMQTMAVHAPELRHCLRPFVGSQDLLQGGIRYVIDLSDEDLPIALSIGDLARRLEAVTVLRMASKKSSTRDGLARFPHEFQHRAPIPTHHAVVVPSVSSERRQWFPVGLARSGSVISNLAFQLVDGPLWTISVFSSRVHLTWIATVCGKLKTDYRYSNTLGWNTFPVPTLTEKNKADLTRCAENILLAREAHFPATIADLYDPDTMPADLREAHERNDEVLERIYIGRRFRNDTERLEKLFELYAKMTSKKAAGARTTKRTGSTS